MKENPKQPFFTYLSFTAPHAGLRIPTTSHLTAKSNYPSGGGLSGGVQWNDDASKGQINTAAGEFDKGFHPLVASATGNDGKPWPIYAKRHASMVKRIDDSVSDLIQLLKDLKVDENTLIVFTSDNGTHHEGGADGVSHYNPEYLATYGPYDGTKRDLWEGGVRMPTFVRWPSHIKDNSRSAQASQFHDWMTTFCDLAGVAAPALSDGVSLVPTLISKGEQQQGTVYVEYSVGGSTPKYKAFEASRQGQKHGQMQSVLIGDYKAVRTNVKNGDEPFEVYHTLKDLKETKNLAGKAEAPQQEDIMAAILRARRANSSANRPYDNQLVPALASEIKSPGKVRLKLISEQFPWVPMTQDLKGENKLVKGLAVEDNEGVQELSTYLIAPEDGEYQFLLAANGQAVVRLHNEVLIDADSHYRAGEIANSGSIYLQKGVHPLKVIYQSAKGKPAMSLQWKTPSGSLENIPSERIGLLE